LSATHKNLAKEVDKGNLRQDLYFRINVIELAVPALRKRRADIPELATEILQKIASENDAEICQLSDDAITALQDYRFPGNVRELENILQRAATLCENNNITEHNLEFMTMPGTTDPAMDTVAEPEPDKATAKKVQQATGHDSEPKDFNLEKHLEAIEIEAIEKALEETRWNKTAAAKKLGMSFRSLRYRLKKLGLD
jgi:two-component system, NtrC family, response regulator PilR